jgi:hypothetical protein
MRLAEWAPVIPDAVSGRQQGCAPARSFSVGVKRTPGPAVCPMCGDTRPGVAARTKRQMGNGTP